MQCAVGVACHVFEGARCHVEAGAEVFATGTQHNDAYLFAFAQSFKILDQCIDQFAVEGIALLGTVEGYPLHLLARFYL